MSELSCDRAAAIITSPETVSSTMARLSGGPKSITQEINFDEWVKQADEYERIRQENAWNKTLQTLAVMQLNHPFSAVRVREIRKWCATDTYANIKRTLEAEGSTLGRKCPNCGSKIAEQGKFCVNCGEKLF